MRPDAQPSSAVTVRTDYVGRYLTVPVNGQPLRLWLYATPEGGRYNLVNEQGSILIAIADQPAEGRRQPEDLAAAAQRLDLKVQRDNAGYHLPRTAHPLTLELDAEQAIAYGHELGAKLAAAS